MPDTVIPLSEPKSADYIHIDSENKVHLLLPIVGGDTIGLDNTCKTVMEMQTFFHGKEGKPSALNVLNDYASKLEKDITFLKGTEAFSKLLAEKEQRLKQITGYTKILEYLQKNTQFIDENAEYPIFPEVIHKFFEKKTNCLTVHLSPKEADFLVRTKDPVFSLNRPIPVKERHGNLIYVVGQQTVRGLAHSLRQHFKNSKNDSIGIKEKFIKSVVDYYKDKPKPTLAQLQAHVTQTILEKYSKQVDLGKSNLGDMTIDEDYFENILATSYDDCDVEEAVSNVLNAALADDFWSGLEENTVFCWDSSLSNDINAEKLSIAVQFFLANTNIYCQAKGLSSKNFGDFLDEYHLKIANQISQAFAKGDSVEAELFKIINENRQAFGLTRPLTAEDQKQIQEDFTVQYRIIKESPHFDEFIFFRPEVKGDFFNHKNRISLHFLDFLSNDDSLTQKTKHDIQQLMSSHQLTRNTITLKQRSSRALSPNNDVGSISFQEFLLSLNDKNHQEFAILFGAQIKNNMDLVYKLNFNELDKLLNHPSWSLIERKMRAEVDESKRTLYIEAIESAKNHLALMHEKILSVSGTPPHISTENWKAALAFFEKSINSYKDKLLFRFKSDIRKEQVKELEVILADLKKPGGDKIQALNHSLASFERISQSIKKSQPDKKSSLSSAIDLTRKAFIRLFNLTGSPIAINPNDPVSVVVDDEKKKFPKVSSYKCLHYLRQAWWTDEGLAIIKSLPESYYTINDVNYLNSSDVKQWDELVLKALQTDKVPLNKTTDFKVLRTRGLFISFLEEKNLPNSLHQSLLKLSAKWWTELDVMDKLVALNVNSLPEPLINFLNTISPDELDDLVLQGLKFRATDQTLDRLTLSTLKDDGKWQLLGDLLDKHPILLNLKQEWWTETGIAVIKKIPSDYYTPAVLEFLNKIEPQHMNEQLIPRIRTLFFRENLPNQVNSSITSSSQRQSNITTSFNDFLNKFEKRFPNTNSDGILKMIKKMKSFNQENISDIDKFTRAAAIMHEIASARADSSWLKNKKFWIFGQGRNQDVQKLYDEMKKTNFSIKDQSTIDFLLGTPGIKSDASINRHP